MDRRNSSRHITHRPVELVLLGGQDTRLAVTLHDLSEGGARIRAAHQLAPGTAVRLDVDDNMFLGEVAYSVAEGNGYMSGLRFQQCLGRMSDIRRLVSALVGPPPPARQSVALR